MNSCVGFVSFFDIVFNYFSARASYDGRKTASNFNILSPVFDNIMQGTVDAVGNNLNLLAVTGALSICLSQECLLLHRKDISSARGR